MIKGGKDNFELAAWGGLVRISRKNPHLDNCM